MGMRKADITPRRERKGVQNINSALFSPAKELPAPFHLTLSPHNLHVQVGQPAGSGQGEFDHPLDSHRVPIKVIKERSVLVVIGDEPQLSPRSIICSREETKRGWQSH